MRGFSGGRKGIKHYTQIFIFSSLSRGAYCIARETTGRQYKEEKNRNKKKADCGEEMSSSLSCGGAILGGHRVP